MSDKSLIVITPESAVTKSLNILTGVDFVGLNKTIEDLGKITDLPTSDRKTALDLIDKWETNVIETIERQSERMKSIACFLTGKYYYYAEELTDSEQELLAQKTNTQKEYDAVKEQEAIVYSLENCSKERWEGDDPELTVIENTKKRCEYESQTALHSLKERRAQNKLARLKEDWLRKMRALPEIKELISKSSKGAGIFKDINLTCKTKAQEARIAVTVKDPELKKSLKDLVSFTKTLF